MEVQILRRPFRLACIPFRAGPSIKPPTASGLLGGEKFSIIHEKTELSAVISGPPRLGPGRLRDPVGHVSRSTYLQDFGLAAVDDEGVSSVNPVRTAHLTSQESPDDRQRDMVDVDAFERVRLASIHGETVSVGLLAKAFGVQSRVIPVVEPPVITRSMLYEAGLSLPEMKVRLAANVERSAAEAKVQGASEVVNAIASSSGLTVPQMKVLTVPKGIKGKKGKPVKLVDRPLCKCCMGAAKVPAPQCQVLSVDDQTCYQCGMNVNRKNWDKYGVQVPLCFACDRDPQYKIVCDGCV